MYVFLFLVFANGEPFFFVLYANSLAFCANCDSMSILPPVEGSGKNGYVVFSSYWKSTKVVTVYIWKTLPHDTDLLRLFWKFRPISVDSCQVLSGK